MIPIVPFDCSLKIRTVNFVLDTDKSLKLLHLYLFSFTLLPVFINTANTVGTLLQLWSISTILNPSFKYG